MKVHSFVVATVVFILLLPVSHALAGGNPPSVACVVEQRDIQQGTKLRGTVAIDATSVSGGQADVVIRLEKAETTSEPAWFRVFHTTTFTDLTLLGHQVQLCEILTNYPSLQQAIRTAFGLPGNSRFVFTKNGIRNAELDVNPDNIVILGPVHAMTVFDVVIFAQ